MRRQPSRHAAGSAAVLVALLATPASAFLVQTFAGNAGPVQAHWLRADQIGYQLHHAAPPGLSPESTYVALRACFAVWEDVATSQAAFVDRGISYTRVPDERDRINLLYFDRTGSHLQAPPESGVIALTRVVAGEPAGAILDADIIFNARDFSFVLGGPVDARTVYLPDVAVHEIGHLLGLEHTPLDGPAATRPTMNPFNRNDGPGEALSLEADDVAGISHLYPTPAFAAQTGTIGGRVTRPDGSAIFGAHVVALERTTGVRISTVSGSDPEASGTGRYTVRGLPPGTYALSVSPISGRITEENFGGIFAGFCTDFDPEWYDDVTDAGRATQLEISAGQALAGIDFVAGGSAAADAPQVEFATVLPNTPDPMGPYPVVLRGARIAGAALQYRLAGRPPATRISLTATGANAFAGALPGQARGTRIEYRYELQGPTGEIAYLPPEEEWYAFAVIELSGAPLAFVALRGADVVAVLDTGPMSEIARIQTPREPIQVALDEQGGRLYVASMGAGEIGVIDTGTFQAVGSFATPAGPLDLALSPARDLLFVTCPSAGAVAAVDLHDGTVTSLAVPTATDGPYGIAAAARAVYLTDISRDLVIAMDRRSGVVRSIPVPALPRSIALDPGHDRAYVTSLASGQITELDLRQDAVAGTATVPVSGTFAAAVHPTAGKLYVTAQNDAQVLVIDAATRSVTAAVGVGADPRGLAFSPDGDRLFVTCAAADRIAVIDAGADTVQTTVTCGPGPRGIAVGLARPAPEPGGTDPRALPTRPVLLPPCPNPFNSSTRLEYGIPALEDRAAPVLLEVYNVAGQRVRVLVAATLPQGFYTAEWDGRDSSGAELAAGVYLFSLRAGGLRAVRRGVLLR